MSYAPREAWITGIGIHLPCLGEGSQKHWEKLEEGHPTADGSKFPPYLVIRWVRLISKNKFRRRVISDRSESLQRIGTYAAGMALDSSRALREIQQSSREPT